MITTILTTAILSVLVTWSYMKSPTWEDKGRLSMAIVLILCSAGLIWFTYGFWNVIQVTPTVIWRLMVIPLIAAIFIYVSISILLLIAWANGGMENINGYKKGGLMRTLTDGFVFGLAGTLSSGLYFGWFLDMYNLKDDTIIAIVSIISFGSLFVLFFYNLRHWIYTAFFGGATVAAIGIINGGAINGTINATVITLAIIFILGIVIGANSEKKAKAKKNQSNRKLTITSLT